MEEQYRMQAQFFDRFLRTDHPDPLTSNIRYYTMGEGKWHVTSVWPPQGIVLQRYYFNRNSHSITLLDGPGERTLTEEPPSAMAASDSYKVDFSATTGKHNRWYTQLDGSDVIYPDRSEEDKKLLTYTSSPLVRDTEITGSPIVSLVLSSTHTDGALHVYLEDVAADGRVTYITEGEFRLLHRKITEKPSPYVPLGPAHTFRRTDAEPLIPGRPVEVAFSLFPTSVVLRKGHSVRVAVAGADASMFRRYPAEGIPTLTVFRQKDRLSYVELPIRKR
jgi:putative CocE/NonD family hydrolase